MKHESKLGYLIIVTSIFIVYFFTITFLYFNQVNNDYLNIERKLSRISNLIAEKQIKDVYFYDNILENQKDNQFIPNVTAYQNLTVNIPFHK